MIFIQQPRSYGARESGRVGENPGNEVVHPNPWKFWNFLPCHYIFPVRIPGLIFFCLWAHTRICTETTWQWLRVARVVFPVRVLFIFGSRYMPEIYRIFTVLYALIVPAKIIFFNIIVIVFTESHQVTMIYCKRPIRFP